MLNKNHTFRVYCILIIQLILMAIIFLTPFLEKKLFLILQSKFTSFVYVSLFVISAGLAVLVVATIQLGKSFSVLAQPPEGAQLVTVGLYRHVRNPIYLGGILVSFGWAILSDSKIVLLASLALTILFFYKMYVEEDFLGTKFGDEYGNYKKRTYRLLPWIW